MFMFRGNVFTTDHVTCHVTLTSLLSWLDLFAAFPHFLFLHVVGEVVEESYNVVTWCYVVGNCLTGSDNVHERVS